MSLLIFVFVIGAVVAFVTGGLFSFVANLRRTASLGQPQGAVLEDHVRGLAKIPVLSGWRVASPFTERSALQILDPLRSRYVVVISDSREDFEPTMTVEEYGARARQALAECGRIYSTRGPQERHVDGYRAVQFEIDIAYRSALITHLITAIDGRRALHLVNAWAPRSMFDRAVFETVLNGFVELPGPNPRTLIADSTLPGAGSAYSVH